MLLLYGRFNQRRLNKQLSLQVAARTQEFEQKNLELQRAYQEMESISSTDKLTGIHNHRYLENHIESNFEQSLRLYQNWHSGKTAQPLHADIVVFMIDMDNFKF